MCAWNAQLRSRHGLVIMDWEKVVVTTRTNSTTTNQIHHEIAIHILNMTSEAPASQSRRAKPSKARGELRYGGGHRTQAVWHREVCRCTRRKARAEVSISISIGIYTS